MIEVSSPFLPAAKKSFSQVWFPCWLRARGLSWRSGVVLHDSWWWGGAFKDHSKNGIASIVSMLLSGPRSKIN